MLMGLCFFHAVVQERRKFGPLGWNIRYKFNDSDIEAAKDIFLMFIEPIQSQKEIKWDSIKFLIGSITYGGRVTDDIDKKLLLTTLNKFFTKHLLDDRFKFCEFEKYKLPKYETKQNYLDFLSKIPNFDHPEIFGLHQNANISY